MLSCVPVWNLENILIATTCPNRDSSWTEMSPTRVQDDQVTALWRAGQGAEGRSGPQARGAHVPGTSWSPWPADRLSRRAGWGRCPWRSPRVSLHPCLTSVQTFVHKYTFSLFYYLKQWPLNLRWECRCPPPPQLFRNNQLLAFRSRTVPPEGTLSELSQRAGTPPGTCGNSPITVRSGLLRSELWVQGYCTNASALASLTLWKHVVLLTQLSDSLRSDNVPNVYKYE